MNAVYPLALEAFLSKKIDLTADNIKVVCLTSAYVYDPTDQFLSDLTGTVFTSPALTSKTVTGGTFKAANLTLGTASGPTIVSAVMFDDTGTAGTSRLIAFWDTNGDGSPINVPTSGGPVTATWNASGIFSI